MKKGFSLIELMVYIAVISVVGGIFTGLVLSVSRSYAKIAVLRNMDIAAITSMERMTRTIRSSTSVDMAGSVLGSTPGTLSLNQLDLNGLNSKTSFEVAGQNIQMKIDNTDEGILLPAGVTVQSLIFRKIDSGKSQAVKIEMQLSGRAGNATSSESYYGTITLRGSYK